MCIICWVILLSSSLSLLVNGQDIRRPTNMANPSTSWINSEHAPYTLKGFSGDKQIRPILMAGNVLSEGGPTFTCGFLSDDDYNTDYLFGVFITNVVNTKPGSITTAVGRVVWSANPDNPVKLHATVNFTSDGNLILRDFDGSIVWSTNTSGKSVVASVLGEDGNLMLVDANSSVVWQSFDHPTDTLVLGQKLFLGNMLRSNRSVHGVHYSLRVTDKELVAQIDSNPPQDYFSYSFDVLHLENPVYVQFINGSLVVGNFKSVVFSPPTAYSSKQYMQLGSDGHLRVFDFNNNDWKEVTDVLSLDVCQYPMACGRYAICSGGQCFCPKASIGGAEYFRPVEERKPNLGCSKVTPLFCNISQHQSLVQLTGVAYFTFHTDIKNTSVDSCKTACLRNCSCKAAIFNCNRDCYLPAEVFSLISTEDNKPLVFVKVQDVPPSQSPNAHKMKKNCRGPTQYGITICSSLISVFIIAFVFVRLRRRGEFFELEQDYFDTLPGIVARFSYVDLKAATQNFSEKIGEGGYGSVFKGTLENGMQVAVKQLDSYFHVKKSFVAEVETIGSIHHVNLVRLIGFCAGKTRLFLVYEFMSNGSLDQWIYHENRENVLEWKWRRQIIYDIAKGLAYLHEDCRHKIIHLDIKPQNILLDENFNAKVADFGLSKLLDKKQSQVVTTMRGTPGYLAPEWLSAVITEKVDVYSFGMVVLETICGRKSFDQSQPDERMHLLRFFRRCAEEGKLLDLVDASNEEDMQAHSEEVVEMLKIGSWCLHSDYVKRPSMSMVVRVLDGVADVDFKIEDGFYICEWPKQTSSSETLHKL